MTPSTDNYTLGKGIVYFNKKEVDGSYKGERDLGNAPEFTFNVELTALEHFSSRGGLRAKDKKIISEVTPGIAFTLDEITEENLALLTLGEVETINQVIADFEDDLADVFQDRYVELSKRAVGIFVLPIDNEAGAGFDIGETVTGGTSAATGEVAFVLADQLYLVAVTGTFVDDEEITGGTSLTTADVNSATGGGVVSGLLAVTDDTETTQYIAETDYTVDATIGRVKILVGGAIVDESDIKVKGSCEVYTYKKIKALAITELEGAIRFVSDNPVGNNMELVLHRVSLTPAGDTAMIGEDWSTLGFEGEVLKDETGHPLSPYFDIIMT